MYKINLKKIPHILITFLIGITIIINSGYALTTVEPTLIYPFLIAISAIFFTYYLVGISKSKSISNIDLQFYILIICILLSLILNLNRNNLISYLRLILILFISFYFTKKVTFVKFANVYKKILIIISLISLLFFSYSLIVGGLSNFPIVSNINDVLYRNCIIYFEYAYYAVARNYGIFWEPGIFSTYLIIGILIEIYISNRPNYLLIILYSICIFTTQSNAGMLMLIVTILLLFEKGKSNTFQITTFFVIISILLIAVIFEDNIKSILLDINYDFFSKYFIDNVSLSTRVLSPLINFKIFMMNPLFGVGFSKSDILFSQLSHSTTVVAQTSTTTQLMSTLGFVGLSLHILPLYKLLKYKKIKIFERLTLVSLILIILNKEPHTFFLCSYIFLFYLLRLRSKNDKESIN